ncbi:MAG: GNAT family N-acetyltransferase [Clostridia bacterium]|nr:GNAT family N-acetyltransferase [Clostridia bacterium]
MILMKEIRQLRKEHHEEYKKLNHTVLDLLENKDWFIPFPEEIVENIFAPDSTLTVYGCLIDGVLAAVSMLDTDWREFAEVAEAAKMPEGKKGAELCASMVLPAYRGQSLMAAVNREIIKEAKEKGFAYLVATAHPDNIASNSSLKKLGLEHRGVITRQGHYLRNVYAMEL